MTNLVQKSICAAANQLSCANRCDTIEHTLCTEKGCFTTFLEESPTVLAALTELEEGAEPSVEVVNGGEEFLCSFCSPKQLHITLAKIVR